MTQFCPRMARHNFRHRVQRRVLVLRRCFCCFWDRLLICSPGKPIRYRMLSRAPTPAVPSAAADGSIIASSRNLMPSPLCHPKDSDLVPLKISLLGDPQIGKTSFLAKYIGDEKDEQGEDHQEKGLNLMDKTFVVQGARIYYSIWEVDGAEKSPDHIPKACQESVAILFMFDLTSRCTLNNVISWYQEARKWNQTAIPILIGTKFDEFIQLPIDLQWTIASQARAYAKAINATLFFSSATYNINVNKIFKFVTANTVGDSIFSTVMIGEGKSKKLQGTKHI
ncbi:spg1 [Gossypium arboreum]|uniref:Spg1 n=1 Tax=Gossypium arboreum TaxID=29729 RepID=A0A0B0MLV9_GOSAR|nr:spg1 [Gossypium arboreum]